MSHSNPGDVSNDCPMCVEKEKELADLKDKLAVWRAAVVEIWGDDLTNVSEFSLFVTEEMMAILAAIDQEGRK